MADWVTFTKRTDDPKLSFIEDVLARRGIPHRRNGRSFHGPILEVPESRIEDANALLAEDHFGDGRVFDDIEDDDPVFEDEDDRRTRIREEAREKLAQAFGSDFGGGADWSVSAWFIAGEGGTPNPDRPAYAPLYTEHGIWIIEDDDDQFCVVERTSHEEDNDEIEELFCGKQEAIEAVIAQGRFHAARLIPGYTMPSRGRRENPARTRKPRRTKREEAADKADVRRAKAAAKKPPTKREVAERAAVLRERAERFFTEYRLPPIPSPPLEVRWTGRGDYWCRTATGWYWLQGHDRVPMGFVGEWKPSFYGPD